MYVCVSRGTHRTRFAAAPLLVAACGLQASVRIFCRQRANVAHIATQYNILQHGATQQYNMLQHACSLQTFDGVEMTECIKKLIRLDEKWIPAKRGWSLYIRLSSLTPPPTCTAPPCRVRRDCSSWSACSFVMRPLGPCRGHLRFGIG